LFNLLDNAGPKYAPAGAASISAPIAMAMSWRSSVCDEGPGIPPGDLERIFDKFYRVQRRTGVVPGRGWALRSVAALSSSGGWIDARNRRDRTGAVLTIRMPVAEVAEIPRTGRRAWWLTPIPCSSSDDE